MSKDRPEGKDNSENQSRREGSESLSREANEGPPRRNQRSESTNSESTNSENPNGENPNGENPNGENPGGENPSPEDPRPEDPRPNDPRPRESRDRDRRDNDHLWVPPIFNKPFVVIRAQGEVRTNRTFSESVEDITGTSVRAQGTVDSGVRVQ